MSRWNCLCCCRLGITKCLKNRRKCNSQWKRLKEIVQFAWILRLRLTSLFIWLHVSCQPSQQLVKKIKIHQFVPKGVQGKERTWTNPHWFKHTEGLVSCLDKYRKQPLKFRKCHRLTLEEEENFQEYAVLQKNLFHCKTALLRLNPRTATWCWANKEFNIFGEVLLFSTNFNHFIQKILHQVLVSIMLGCF